MARAVPGRSGAPASAVPYLRRTSRRCGLVPQRLSPCRAASLHERSLTPLGWSGSYARSRLRSSQDCSPACWSATAGLAVGSCSSRPTGRNAASRHTRPTGARCRRTRSSAGACARRGSLLHRRAGLKTDERVSHGSSCYRMLIARPISNTTAVKEMEDCIIIVNLAQRDSTGTSVGEKAVLVLNATNR